ncbi:MAG: hypothetical protein KDA32_07170 [Phycisphaerales bacterium]|nr:hypothetical protein [Phycisphaerales bacterium]
MKRRVRALGRAGVPLIVAIIAIGGCTAESTRIALETQRRADDTQRAVQERQHDALKVLLFRELTGRMESEGVTLSTLQRAALNDAWNERDLIEFWNEQYQRAEALRMIGVDAKLFGDQGPLDLITRQIALRVDRVEQGLVNAAAEEAAASVAAEPAEQRSGDEQ